MLYYRTINGNVAGHDRNTAAGVESSALFPPGLTPTRLGLSSLCPGGLTTLIPGVPVLAGVSPNGCTGPGRVLGSQPFGGTVTPAGGGLQPRGTPFVAANCVTPMFTALNAVHVQQYLMLRPSRLGDRLHLPSLPQFTRLPFPQQQPRPNRTVKCQLCDMTLNSELQAKQHYNGKTHLRRVRQLDRRSSASSPSVTAGTSTEADEHYPEEAEAAGIEVDKSPEGRRGEERVVTEHEGALASGNDGVVCTTCSSSPVVSSGERTTNEETDVPCDGDGMDDNETSENADGVTSMKHDLRMPESRKRRPPASLICGDSRFPIKRARTLVTSSSSAFQPITENLTTSVTKGTARGAMHVAVPDNVTEDDNHRDGAKKLSVVEFGVYFGNSQNGALICDTCHSKDTDTDRRVNCDNLKMNMSVQANSSEIGDNCDRFESNANSGMTMVIINESDEPGLAAGDSGMCQAVLEQALMDNAQLNKPTAEKSDEDHSTSSCDYFQRLLTTSETVKSLISQTVLESDDHFDEILGRIGLNKADTETKLCLDEVEINSDDHETFTSSDEIVTRLTTNDNSCARSSFNCLAPVQNAEDMQPFCPEKLGLFTGISFLQQHAQLSPSTTQSNSGDSGVDSEMSCEVARVSPDDERIGFDEYSCESPRFISLSPADAHGSARTDVVGGCSAPRASITSSTTLSQSNSISADDRCRAVSQRRPCPSQSLAVSSAIGSQPLPTTAGVCNTGVKFRSPSLPNTSNSGCPGFGSTTYIRFPSFQSIRPLLISHLPPSSNTSTSSTFPVPLNYTAIRQGTGYSGFPQAQLPINGSISSSGLYGTQVYNNSLMSNYGFLSPAQHGLSSAFTSITSGMMADGYGVNSLNTSAFRTVGDGGIDCKAVMMQVPCVYGQFDPFYQQRQYFQQQQQQQRQQQPQEQQRSNHPHRVENQLQMQQHLQDRLQQQQYQLQCQTRQQELQLSQGQPFKMNALAQFGEKVRIDVNLTSTSSKSGPMSGPISGLMMISPTLISADVTNHGHVSQSVAVGSRRAGDSSLQVGSGLVGDGQLCLDPISRAVYDNFLNKLSKESSQSSCRKRTHCTSSSKIGPVKRLRPFY